MPAWAQPVVRYILEVGLPATLRVSAIAVVGSTAIGIVLGTLLTVHSTLLRAPIRAYLEVFRGLPILVTVFMVYFGLPAINSSLEFGPLTATAIALILWGSAQVAEATRGAVQSIPREQHEAAAALGFGWVGRHRSVILPQALRRLLPPLVNLLVRDLRLHRARVLPHLLPADTARRVPREAAGLSAAALGVTLRRGAAGSSARCRPPSPSCP